MEIFVTFESDLAYLERRARQERDLAENAADPCAYRTHVELARQYERRLTMLMREKMATEQESARASAHPPEAMG